MASSKLIPQISIKLLVSQKLTINKKSLFADGVTTVYGTTSAGELVQLTEHAGNQYNALRSDALTSFLLSFLWVLPFAVFCYWVATFIGGALWVLYTTTEKIGDGDLTSRLGFHPGRDEFGTIGCALDKSMDTLSELVNRVKENANTLSENVVCI